LKESQKKARFAQVGPVQVSTKNIGGGGSIHHRNQKPGNADDPWRVRVKQTLPAVVVRNEGVKRRGALGVPVVKKKKEKQKNIPLRSTILFFKKTQSSLVFGKQKTKKWGVGEKKSRGEKFCTRGKCSKSKGQRGPRGPQEENSPRETGPESKRRGDSDGGTGETEKKQQFQKYEKEETGNGQVNGRVEGMRENSTPKTLQDEPRVKRGSVERASTVARMGGVKTNRKENQPPSDVGGSRNAGGT